jgi:hypothetical protein
MQKLPYAFLSAYFVSACFVILFSSAIYYSTFSPFISVPLLKTPANGKTAVNEVKILYYGRLGLGELKTHET